MRVLIIFLLLVTPSVCFASNTLGKVVNSLSGKTQVEKEAIKINAFTKLEIPIKYTYKGIDIEITKISEEKGLLKVICNATKDGKKIDLGRKNPFWFKNPPILIPDGTMTITQIDRYNFEVANFKEDLLGALKIIIGQAIELIK